MKLFVKNCMFMLYDLLILNSCLQNIFLIDHVSYKKQEDKCLWIISEYLGTMQF